MAPYSKSQEDALRKISSVTEDMVACLENYGEVWYEDSDFLITMFGQVEDRLAEVKRLFL